MKGFDLLRLKSAIQGRNTFDLSNQHITTMDFNHYTVAYYMDMVRGDKINLNGLAFSRMSPLAVPGFYSGSLNLKTASVFVPYSCLFPEAQAFFSGSDADNGFPCISRYVYQANINQIIIQQWCDEIDDPSDSYDFVTVDTSGSGSSITYIQKYYRLKEQPEYRHAYQLLRSLGYVFGTNAYVPNGTTTTYDTKEGQISTKINVLPILSFLKAYNDLIGNPFKRSKSTIANFLRDVFVKKSSVVDSDGRILDYSQMFYLLIDALPVLYDNDYLNSAWASPFGVTDNSSSEVSTLTSDRFEPVYKGKTSSYGIDGDPNTSAIDLGTQYTSAQTNSILERLQKFITRNGLSGSNAAQKLLSRFGISGSSDRHDYAQLISTSKQPIQVQDVMNQADSTGSILGDYAGKGIISNHNIQTTFEAKEHGFFMVLAWLDVKPIYANQADHMIYRTKPLHFYTPEYDGLIGQPIPLSELGTLPNSDMPATHLDTRVFGYTNSYTDYKSKRDIVTGDFSRPMWADMDKWLMKRDIHTLRANGSYAQSDALLQQSAEYDHIFTQEISSSVADHFYVMFAFNVKAERNMLNVSQSSLLPEGDITIQRNGAHL